MKGNKFFIVFVIILTSVVGMIIYQKIELERARSQCHANGGSWNFWNEWCDE